MWRLIKLGVGLAGSCLLPGCEQKPLLIPACVETDHVRASGDAADDVAIWIDRSQPDRSVVIGTNKKAGLHLYDLTGRELQFVPLGGTNNVDIRSGFSFSGGPAALIAATSSSDSEGYSTITFLHFDETSRRIVSEPLATVSAGLPRGALGVCLYQSSPGAVHVGAVSKQTFRQWRLKIEGDDVLHAQPVRELKLDSATEACVFDDALQRLYIGEEELGLWRLAADPEDGDTKQLVDGVKPKGGFTADIEGVAIYARDDGTGYLIASSQGDSSFRIYRREGDNEFVDSFRVAPCPNGGVDAVTHTDGIEVTSAPLGVNWPSGVLIVQDHKNTDPRQPQNFKYVSWDQIVRASDKIQN